MVTKRAILMTFIFAVFSTAFLQCSDPTYMGTLIAKTKGRIIYLRLAYGNIEASDENRSALDSLRSQYTYGEISIMAQLSVLTASSAGEVPAVCNRFDTYANGLTTQQKIALIKPVKSMAGLADLYQPEQLYDLKEPQAFEFLMRLSHFCIQNKVGHS